MKATKFLSACSMALALMVVAPGLAQEPGLVTQEDQEEELLAIPFFVKRVAVECNGGCGDSNLGQICGSGWRPIAVDCGNVNNWSDDFVFDCGGDNRCRNTSVLTGQALSLYCDDGSGWDANVYCAQ